MMGWVRFFCEGGFPERFLNEAAESGVELWNITREDIVLYGCCAAKQYRMLRKAARAASVRMRVCERHGLWFRLRPFRLRWGIVVGAVCFAVLLQLLSSRIWVIRLEGNERVSDTAIRDVLQPLGVYEGAVFDRVNIAQVQLTALERLPELMWLTVNVEGSTATVLIKERQASEPIGANTPANIVAVRDGVIAEMHTVTGQAAVAVGDAVTEGTLLISGVMDSKVGPLLKRADGMVMAHTVRTAQATVPFDEEVFDPNPPVLVRPCVYILGWQIPLYSSAEIEGEYTIEEENCFLQAYGKPLPIGLRVERLVFQKTDIRSRTPDGARAEAKARLNATVKTWGDTVRVEREEITEQQTDSGITLVATYHCTEPIGKVVPLQMNGK